MYAKSRYAMVMRGYVHMCFPKLGGSALQSSQSRQNDDGTVEDAGSLGDICRALIALVFFAVGIA